MNLSKEKPNIDQVILREAQKHPKKTLSLLVQIELSELSKRQVNVGQHMKLDGLPTFVSISSGGLNTHDQLKIEEYERFLRALGATPRWLQTSRAFIVEVSAEQLPDLQRHVFTKEIHENHLYSK